MKKVPLVLVAFSCSLSLYDQVSKSNLVGIIRDQTGAAVPGATVRLVAQEAEELAVVLEEDAEHFGDGDDVLADRNFFENFLLDPLGKENDSLLMARRAEIP
jgi:hypothetical protein